MAMNIGWALVAGLAGALACVPVAASAADPDANVASVRPAPVMGWSSWSFLRKDPTTAKVEAQARALRDSGLQRLGYVYVNLDDFWYQCPGAEGPNVDAFGRWIIDAAKFPPRGGENGIQALADDLHAMGMKFGIYATPGISLQAVAKNTPIEGTGYTARQIAEPSVAEFNYNCKGMVKVDYAKPGAQRYTDSIVKQFAAWGVDFIKLDGMTNDNAPDVVAWSRAIGASGRPMVLDVTQGSFTPVIGGTLVRYANQWEAAPDVECYDCEKHDSSYPLTSWNNIKDRFDFAMFWQPYVSPGHFHDFDSIEVGNGNATGLTPNERKTQLSLWALGASPLILGVDATHLVEPDLGLLRNAQVIAVDQDSIAAKRVLNDGNDQVYAKLERGGTAVVGLFNLGPQASRLSISATAIGLAADSAGYTLTDLWTGRARNSGRMIVAEVPPHGVVLYRVGIASPGAR